MPNLSTLTKMRIARMLSRSAIGLRKLKGRPSHDIFSRRGLRWKLDLSEGIDLSIYLFGQFERNVFEAYRKILRPGSIALDVGANIGAHALPMARFCGKRGIVHAFEPTVYAVEKLRENLALNSDLKGQLAIHHALLNEGAASSSLEAIPSSWRLDDRGDDEKHPQHGGSYKEIKGAAVLSIDQFAEEHGIVGIDLIKLDVDGNEWSVIKGGAATIDRYGPPFLMEFAPYINEEGFEEMVRFFREHHYCAVNIDNLRPVSLDEKELKRIVPGYSSINVLMKRTAE